MRYRGKLAQNIYKGSSTYFEIGRKIKYNKIKKIEKNKKEGVYNMENLQKERLESAQKEKEILLTDEKRTRIYEMAQNVSPSTIDDICPVLFDVILSSAEGRLKNELGRVIFHLQKNERLNTRIGLERLLDAGLRVNAEKTFRILESGPDDAKELAESIRKVL